MNGAVVFSEYARYYDLLYKDKDYATEADYVHGLIQRYGTHTRSIIELGSGTGKHAVLLVDRGYEVQGIERSEDMIAHARDLSEKCGRTHESEWLPPTFYVGDIRSTRLDRQFDAAVSLFHVVSYQTTNADLLATFETARVHVRDGGVFIFDVWYGPAVLSERPAVRIRRMADDHIEVTRLAEPVTRPNDNVVEVHYHVFIRNRRTGVVTETREVHYMRYVFEPEIELLARLTGFRVCQAEEWLTGKRLDFGSWGACFVLRSVSRGKKRRNTS